jgi:hypothetical protein
LITTTATVEITVESYIKLSFAEPAYITARTIQSNPNIELTTPTIVVLNENANAAAPVANRFSLVSRNESVATRLQYSVYYDVKYSDLIIIPSLETLLNMTYIQDTVLKISAYGLNFSGLPGGKVPTPNTGYAVSSDLLLLSRQVGKIDHGGYMERMVNGQVNMRTGGLNPSVFINFGLPSAMFTPIGFVADINMLTYSSLFDRSLVNLGNQVVVDGAHIIAELPQ